ncbi:MULTISPECIES: DUF1801 domain-containing protein [Nitrincola]|uniref:YdhG-like domain-containing protein n=1 Tax=Nitrincola nitratireducens TaxID=1229521 RepID=W9UVS9_9GAMM|nr:MULTISPECIES: DUF1801 domain-containing protein [Nitrincola]EXJ11323.1 hypothetical protein D791_01778 [Nitrincola nitratireducens]
MKGKTVDALLEDIHVLGVEQYALVEQVRALVSELFAPISEEVKYGGILFSSDVQFCGVFAYKKHVSVEFVSGAKIHDSLGHLEGTGKGRRHIKLYVLQDIQDKQLAHYLQLALDAAKHDI